MADIRAAMAASGTTRIGTFGTPVERLPWTRGTALADLNGDGRLDAVGADGYYVTFAAACATAGLRPRL